MNKRLNVYASARYYAGLTIACFNEGNLNRFEACLNIAERIYTKGSAEIRSAISSVFLCTLSNSLELKKISLFNSLKSNLKKEYVRQLNSSGI